MYRVYIISLSPLRMTVINCDTNYSEIYCPDDELFDDKLDAWKHLFEKYAVDISQTDIFDKLDSADKELKNLMYKDLKMRYYH